MDRIFYRTGTDEGLKTVLPGDGKGSAEEGSCPHPDLTVFSAAISPCVPWWHYLSQFPEETPLNFQVQVLWCQNKKSNIPFWSQRARSTVVHLGEPSHFLLVPPTATWGFPDGSRGKESTYQCGRHGFDPWVRKTPWRREWQPTSGVLPGESRGQGAWQVIVHGAAELDMTEHSTSMSM